MENRFENRPFLHICECCGKTELLTAREAYEQGWDYPGDGGIYSENAFGVVGPRTCGACPIDRTAWWELVVRKKEIHELSEKHRRTLNRILQEPEILEPHHQNGGRNDRDG